MAMESVLWTLLPCGFDRDRGLLRGTIMVAPRLGTDGAGFRRLEEYEAFRNWPEALRELKFQVDVEGVGTADAEPDPRIVLPDPEAWKLIFGGDVGVVDHEFRDLGAATVRTYPADEVANDILDLYSTVAADHPFGFPPLTTGPLREWADDLGDIGDNREKTYRRLDGLYDAENGPRRQEGHAPPPDRRGRFIPRNAIPAAQRRRFAFLQAYRFYDRFLDGVSVRGEPGPPDPARVPPEPIPPAIDFHGYVGALGDHPFLLRRLGLAIDVVFDQPAAFVGDRRIRALAGGNPQPWMVEPTASPWLNYRLDDRFFLPRPREVGREVVDGQLNLPSDFYAVHQIDIDGSALKAVNLAASLEREQMHLAEANPSMTPDESSLPALRSTGFTVVQRNRAETVVGQLDQSAQHNGDLAAGIVADLYADDVTRGYRVDVDLDVSGRFFSLCHRVGTYSLDTAGGPVPIDVPPDEGYTKAASTTAVPKDSELYLHEAVTSWSGWSLVAKRPGKTIDKDDALEDPPLPLKVDPGVPLHTSFVPSAGTLPRLRYGTPYRFRVRVVDLAGNSLDRDEIDDQLASRPQPFFRWEPVPSPAVIARRPYSEGESQLRMVIRSTLDTDVGTYVGLPRVTALTGHTTPDTAYEVHNDRWLAAPKTAQQMAELYGVFDDAIGLGLPQTAVDAAFAIGAKESGVLPETEPGETLALPYLPDVSSRGVAFTTLPNDAANTPTRTLAWPVDDVANRPWWDRQPFRVRIVEGPAAGPVTPAGVPTPPDWDEAARLLTVFLPQAELVTVRLSSFLAPGDLDIQGLWNRMPPVNAQSRAAAEQGRMWMFTPWADLVLVHAVEKPLLAPVVDVPASGMQRNLGETFCVLSGSIDVHAKSTGRLDVEASWDEQVDDLRQPVPDDGVNGGPVRSAHSHVGDFSLEADEDDCQVGRDDRRRLLARRAVHQLRHELGDTKHRLVRYQAMATTRFREYFPPEVVEGVDPDSGERLVERVGPVLERHVPSSRRPEPPEVAYVLPTFSWSQSALGTVPVEQGPGDIFRHRFSTVTRTRKGGGLRVYLKRGWYSSGDGELLGVVLADQPWITWPVDRLAGLEVDDTIRLNADRIAERLFDRSLLVPKGRRTQTASERLVQAAGITAAELAGAEQPRLLLDKLAVGLKAVDLDLGPIILELLGGIDPDKLTTHWGRDPVWGSDAPASGPFIHQLPLRTAVGTGLSLSETRRATVTVVGHTPEYDPVRRLWFCDLQLEAGSSYTPFVRLALARYQPHSIPDAHLSRVVLADFAQLLPDRTLAVTVRPGQVGVSVTGPVGYNEVANVLTGQPASVLGLNLSRRVSAQAQRLPAGADPDLGWVDAGAAVDLAPTLGESGLAAVRWSGTLPSAADPDGAEQRVLVRELEVHRTDADTDDPLEATRVIHAGPVEFPTNLDVRERLVYADTLPI